MNPIFAATTEQGIGQYFIGWGTLSLINAGLAQSKGHSGLAWWFISLLLGPVATFLIVVFLQPPTPQGILSQGHPGKPVADQTMFEDLA